MVLYMVLKTHVMDKEWILQHFCNSHQADQIATSPHFYAMNFSIHIFKDRRGAYLYINQWVMQHSLFSLCLFINTQSQPKV